MGDGVGARERRGGKTDGDGKEEKEEQGERDTSWKGERGVVAREMGMEERRREQEKGVGGGEESGVKLSGRRELRGRDDPKNSL